jgi:hypothetical protein
MPQTVYERLQSFYSKHPDFQFSQSKKKRICKTLKWRYDNHEGNPPITYKDVVDEAGKAFQVRNYPDQFVPVMDAVIHATYKTHIANTEKELQINP